MMKHKRNFKFLTLGLALMLSMFLATGTVSLAYEDEYAKNGDIGWRQSELYKNGIYTLNNKMNGTPSKVILFLAVQNSHYINSMDVVYSFDGKLNYEDSASYQFEFRMGMPSNYEELQTIEFGGVETKIRQAQFGIYPGFYNFFYYGNNYSNLSGKTPWYVVTLSPSWNLVEKDSAYKDMDNPPEETFVEIVEGDVKRLYVLVGELDYLNLAREDFEEWALATEAGYIKDSMQSGILEEIEVEVPEENLQKLLDSAKPEVELEEEKVETTTSPFEVVAPKEEEKKSLFSVKTVSSVALGIAAVVFLWIFGKKILAKIKASRY